MWRYHDEMPCMLMGKVFYKYAAVAMTLDSNLGSGAWHIKSNLSILKNMRIWVIWSMKKLTNFFMIFSHKKISLKAKSLNIRPKRTKHGFSLDSAHNLQTASPCTIVIGEFLCIACSTSKIHRSILLGYVATAFQLVFNVCGFVFSFKILNGENTYFLLKKL